MDWAGLLLWRVVRYRRAGRRWQAARTYLRMARAQRSAGMLVRAGAVLLGERAMALRRHEQTEPVVAQPAWLDLYR
jgi:hypothetical protein